MCVQQCRKWNHDQFPRYKFLAERTNHNSYKQSGEFFLQNLTKHSYAEEKERESFQNVPFEMT